MDGAVSYKMYVVEVVLSFVRFYSIPIDGAASGVV